MDEQIGDFMDFLKADMQRNSVQSTAVSDVAPDAMEAPSAATDMQPLLSDQIGNILDNMLDDEKCTESDWNAVKGMLLIDEFAKKLEGEFKRLGTRHGAQQSAGQFILSKAQEQTVFKGLLRFAKLPRK